MTDVTPKLLAEFQRLYPQQIAGSKAEYRRADYVFPREQSVAMKLLEWEHQKEQQPEPWWLVCLGGFGWVLFAIACFMLANALKGI